jgi:hypothetical protein
MVGNDFCKLILQAHPAYIQTRLVVLEHKQEHLLHHQASLSSRSSGRFREKKETNTENESPEELDCDWDTTGTGIITVLCGIYDIVCKENVDRDTELIASN